LIKINMSGYYLKDLLLESGCKYKLFLYIYYKNSTIFLKEKEKENKHLIIKLLNYIILLNLTIKNYLK